VSQADTIRIAVVLVLCVGLFLVFRGGLKWRFLALEYKTRLEGLEKTLQSYGQTFYHYTEQNRRLRDANEGLLQERNDLQRSLRRFEAIQEDQERLRNLARHGSGFAPAFGESITGLVRSIRNSQPEPPVPPPLQPQARAEAQVPRGTELASLFLKHFESRTPAAPAQPRSWQERIVEPDPEEDDT
jgi:hypothetical protein